MPGAQPRKTPEAHIPSGMGAAAVEKAHPTQALSVLAKQGFWLNSGNGNFRGNFWLDRPVGSEAELCDVVTIMLETLYGGYDAHIGSIEIHAPLAMEENEKELIFLPCAMSFLQ